MAQTDLNRNLKKAIFGLARMEKHLDEIDMFLFADQFCAIYMFRSWNQQSIVSLGKSIGELTRIDFGVREKINVVNLDEKNELLLGKNNYK